MGDRRGSFDFAGILVNEKRGRILLEEFLGDGKEKTSGLFGGPMGGDADGVRGGGTGTDETIEGSGYEFYVAEGAWRGLRFARLR